MRRCVQAGACGLAAANSTCAGRHRRPQFSCFRCVATLPKKMRERAPWLSHAHVAPPRVVSMVEAEARRWLPLLGWGMYVHI